jgi:hypothetical protein
VLILSKKRDFILKEVIFLIRILKQISAKERTYALLLDDLKRTKSDLELSYSNFENVVDPDLIDSCIYQINAVQMRYKFLLARVKQMEEPCVEAACGEEPVVQ